MRAARLTALVSSICALFALPHVLTAAAGETTLSELDTPPAGITGTSMAGSLVWVVIALLIVVGLIVLLIKFLANRSRIWGSNRSLRTLGGIALGPNKSLQVVDIGGQLYLVGVGEDVTLLDKIDDPQQAEAIVRSLDQQAAPLWNTSGIADAIARYRGGGNKARASEEEQGAASFQSILQDKLQRQSENKQKVESLLNDSKQTDRLLDE